MCVRELSYFTEVQCFSLSLHKALLFFEPSCLGICDFLNTYNGRAK